MGKFSRSKGRREEQQLVLHLYGLGWKAERVLRQYQAAELPDVVATKEDKTFTFEMKSRNASFKKIYELYNSEKDEKGQFCFILDSSNRPVAISTQFESLLDVYSMNFRNLSSSPIDAKKLKTCTKIVTNIREMKQTADFLVLRDNNKPRLFFRFWS